MGSLQRILCLVSLPHRAASLTWEHWLLTWRRLQREEGEEGVHRDREQQGEGQWHMVEHRLPSTHVVQLLSKIAAPVIVMGEKRIISKTILIASWSIYCDIFHKGATIPDIYEDNFLKLLLEKCS